MCVPMKYSDLIPLAFLLSVFLMCAWSLYIAMRAKKACVNPASYRYFYWIFNAIGGSRRNRLSFPFDGFLFPVDQRDVDTLILYRKVQFVGFILILIVVMTIANYFVPIC